MYTGTMYTGTLITDLMAVVERAERNAERKRTADENWLQTGEVPHRSQGEPGVRKSRLLGRPMPFRLLRLIA
jgi:hypothetical protein